MNRPLRFRLLSLTLAVFALAAIAVLQGAAYGAEKAQTGGLPPLIDREVFTESDQIVRALRDRKRPVEYLVAPDEGHGFAGRMNNLATYAKVEEFLAKHLGGRYQKEVRKEIQDQLQALTVDVSTLTASQ